MDPLSSTCAALQLLGSAASAVKILRLLYKQFKKFRHLSDEIGRIFTQVDCQRRIYHTKMHLLLQYGGQHEDVIERMLDEDAHPQWTSAELYAELEKFFGDSLSTIWSIVEQIDAVLASLLGQTCDFDTLMKSRHKGESMKDACRRLREKVKTTCNISKIDSQVKEFRDLNQDLINLIRGIVEVEANKSSLPLPMLPSGAPGLPQEYGSIARIKRASKDLYKVLDKAWLDSLDPESFELSKHNVKLLLDAQAEQEVQLGVAITCHGQCLKEQSSPRSAAVKLHVRSCLIDFIESTTPTQSDGNDNGRQKRPRVRFADMATDPVCTSKVETTTSFAQKVALPPDLGQNGNICTVFHAKSPQRERKPKCLGYLDSRGGGDDDDAKSPKHRHKFFPVRAGPSGLAFTIPASLCASMRQLLSQPVPNPLTVVEQLKLARSLVMAALKFHSTPWLQDCFSLQDVSFFHSDDRTIAECLQTAHLTIDLVHQPLDSDSAIVTSDMSGTDEEVDNVIETVKLTHGVHNLTLWSLGTVLLQIGSWSIIESSADVAQVRRLAQNNCKLGRRYRELTEQCLECNFAFGYDLSKLRLQQAVYETVAEGLSAMIKSLSIGDEPE